MFKKLKDKITEDLKSSPQRFQQLTQSVSDRLSTSTNDENFFSIGDDDANMSTNSAEAGFSSLSLVSPSEPRIRRTSNSSMASDVSFLPRYESSAMYQLQSDLDVSASEVEDNVSTSSQLGHLSKEQIYSAFQKAQMRYHKYRGRYTDLAKHYKDLERENGKMKSVLVETQDKAIRRVRELKEQCSLEQKAKAHLEGVLRDELDEKQFKIQTLETKIGLLSSQSGADTLVDLQNDNDKENLDTLTKYLNDARQEIESLNSKLQEYKANSIVFQSKEQEYKKKITGLENELSKFSEREKENNLKLAQNKMELHNEILNKDAEILNMKKDLEVLRKSLEAYETQTHTSKVENLQAQNTKLIERVEALTQRSNNLESELLKVEQYKLEIRNLNSTVQDLKSSLKTKEDALKELNEKLATAGGEDDKLNKDRENLHAGLQTFRMQVNYLNKEKEMLKETISKEKADYERQIAEIRESTKIVLVSLERKLTEKITSEFAAKEDKLKEDFKQKLNELNTNGANVKEIQMKLMEKESQLQKLNEDLTSSETDRISKENLYKNLEKNHLELIEDCTKLRSTVATLEKELSDIRNDNSETQKKIIRMQSNISTLEADLNEAREQLQQKDEECMSIQKEKVHLDEQLKLAAQKDELQSLEVTESRLLEMKLSKLEEDNEKLKRKLDEEFTRNSQLDLEIGKMKSLVEDHGRLSQKLPELELEIDKLKDCKSDLREELAQAQKTVGELNKTLEEKRKVEDDYVNLKSASEKYGDKIKTLENDLEETRKMLMEKERECMSIENERTHLAEQLKLQEEKGELDALEHSECKLLELKLTKMEEQIVDLNERLDVERRNNENLTEQLKESKKLVQEYNIYKDRVPELEFEITKLSDQKQELDDRLKAAEERNHEYVKAATEKEALEEVIKELEQERAKLVDSFEHERKLFNQTHEQNVANELKLEKLLEENINMSKDKDTINKLNEELQRQQQERDKDSRTITDLRNKVESLTVFNEALDKEIKDRNAEVTDMNKKIEELSSVIKKQTEEFASLLDRSNQLDVIIEKMQVDNSNALRKEKAVQNELSQKIEACQNEVSAKTEEIKLLQSKISDLEQLNNVDKENLKTLEDRNRELQERLTKLEAMEESFKMIGEEKQVVENELTRLKIMESSFVKLKEDNQLISAQLDNIMKEKQELTTGKQTLTENYNLLKVNLDEVTSERDDLQRKLQQLKTQMEENAASGLEKATKEIQELNLRINQLSSDNNHVNDENQELLSQVEELKVNNEYLRTEQLKIDSLKAEYEERNRKLKEELEEATGKISEAQRQNLELANSKTITNETDIMKIQQDCYEIKEKCDNLFIENKNLKLEIGNLEEKCNNFAGIKRKYETQIAELEHQYNELVHEKQLLQDEVQELKISPLNLQNNSTRLDNLEIIKQEKAFQAGSNNDKYVKEIDSLRDKLTQYKSLDITNKSSIEFYENELQKMKNKNEKLSRKLDETLVTLNHCAELSQSTEIEYLKNVLYNYMLGKESMVLARVIAAVCKFDPQQTENILQKEQQKQTLLGQLGIL
ncbi:uncharacterized protein LOC109602437 [Aethina tumida]|uniref:uncharacterized protein LOC109602437 n=1 Tax=Aethina tumida TaxID=116153 RepID=UPI0021484AE7|nr:uncharacterized protein LOC109602437 [Aethina tumida]